MRVVRKAIDGAVALEGERGEADQLAGVLLENLGRRSSHMLPVVASGSA